MAHTPDRVNDTPVAQATTPFDPTHKSLINTDYWIY
jgi:hypothetical protein